MTTELEELTARSLLELVKEHKAKCNSGECNISLALMRPVFKRLVKRELTEEENKHFF